MGYDKYYQTENLFGEAYSELVSFFQQYPQRGKLLDLGCGQGRDALPLARLGFTVSGIDNSKVGVQQIVKKAREESLPLEGMVADIYAFNDFFKFDFILLDSMFHFTKKDRKKEADFIKKIIDLSTPDTVIVFCIQDIGKKVQTLNEVIESRQKQKRIHETGLKYEYKDDQTNHTSITNYQLIVIKKEE